MTQDFLMPSGEMTAVSESMKMENHMGLSSPGTLAGHSLHKQKFRGLGILIWEEHEGKVPESTVWSDIN